jgi:hypothetical protein
MFDLSFSFAEAILREVDTSERDTLLLRLKDEWRVGPAQFWFPIAISGDENRPAHTEAFQALAFEEELTTETFRKILFDHQVEKAFELRESDDICEIELSQLYPIYTGLEGMWFTSQLDWLVYASHESSVTVGGKWLLPAVKAAWPNWEKRIYTTPFYERTL